ncbi:sialate O-acetylesterase [Flammeovirgaceae bacterium SG7u.111]|nr:sialate O-acetylesterase [Flammeovirgaceae bacterium SG7u.132]WPO34700.1 sialate O-acetylesterase [Flammeovirgaceae bacterium SG7u.111]
MLRTILFFVIFICLSTFSLFAKVTLPAVFQENMVLQRDMPVRVWGWANPRERVAVTLRGRSYVTYTNRAGEWEVMMDPLPAGGPFQLNVLGKNLITIDNVMIGDVWLCSGQSNMRWRVKDSKNAEQEIQNARYPAIRLLNIPTARSFRPAPDMPPAVWEETLPETIGDFSAVGYYFGRFLYEKMQVPIGLVNVSWGGTNVQAWMPSESLIDNPKYKTPIELTKGLPGTVEEVEKSQGKPLDKNKYPSLIYNAMVAPFSKMTIKGVIWYQGEANANRNESYEYQTLFPTLISSWREKWGQEFPFLFVQLANFKKAAEYPEENSWAELREAQLKTLELPKTGMAVTIDIGDATNIHPKNKQEVGRRLGLAALSQAYGEKDVVSSGPLYDSAWVEGNKMKIRFTETGSGLASTDKYGYLKSFSIAGENREFSWAKAEITSANELVVFNDSISKPMAVRYAWAINPAEANLINKEGLPASPFRTDDWPGITDSVNIRQAFLPKESIDTVDVANRSMENLSAKVPPLALPQPENLKEWKGQRDYYRGKVMESLGLRPSDMPGAKPVRARFVGAPLDYPDYQIRKLLYEAETGFWVTANLYIPKKGEAPYPAVVYFAGHTYEGKFTEDYQKAMISFAKKGYVVLGPDELGGGERKFTGQTGAYLYLTGTSPGGLQVRDGVKAVDYLHSRTDLVDTTRIAATGHSGGAFHTFYLSAIDERIKCAAPIMYIASYEGMIRSSKAHTMDNYVVHPRMYFEQSQLLSLIAPRPVFMGVGEQDFFPIDAAMETYENAKKIYELYGAGENLQIEAIDTGHVYTPQHRESVNAFFNKNFNVDAPSNEPEITVEAVENLTVGMPSYSAATLSTVAYNRSRNLPDTKLEGDALKEKIKDVLGFSTYYQPSLEIRASTPELNNKDSVVKERVIVETEPEVQLVGELYYKENTKNNPVVYLLGGSEGQKDSLVQQGFAVFEMEPRAGNNGERNKSRNKIDLEYLTFSSGVFLGKPLFGQKVFDVLRGLDYIKTRRKVCDLDKIALLSPDSSLFSLIAIYVAALDDQVKTTVISRPLMTYKAAGTSESFWHDWPFAIFQTNILKFADVPDVAELIAPRALFLSEGKDTANKPILSGELRGIRSEYTKQKAFGNLKINSAATFEQQLQFLIEKN